MNIYILAAIIPLLIAPWLGKLIWKNVVTWWQVVISIGIGCIVTAAIVAAGAVSMVADVEILNGEVTSKKREHGHYIHSYQCNCVTSCSGSGQNRSCSTTCQTCYEDHYTVTWTANTNVGPYTIEHLDRTSRSVYRSPDPKFYIDIQRGDPVAKRSSFVNYIKGAPDSLFHARATITAKFAGKIPVYPDGVYNFYNLNRALSVGVAVPDIAQWNKDISVMLKKLGPQRQANVIVVFVNTADQSYLYALEAAWLGGKKNDIVVIIGTTSYPKIDWVGVSSWTDRQLFKVQLRDDIYALGNIDRESIIKLIDQHTTSTFVRKSMKDFEYLKDSIVPPTWVLIVSVILGIVVALGISYAMFSHSGGVVRFGRSAKSTFHFRR